METAKELWQVRRKGGRAKLFATPERLWDAACEYFDWSDHNPMYEVKYVGEHRVKVPRPRPYTRQALCLFLGVNTQYLKTLKAQLRPDDPQFEEFSNIIERIEAVIYVQKFEGVVVSIFKANIVARELGLLDKKSREITQLSVVVRRDEESGDVVISAER